MAMTADDLYSMPDRFKEKVCINSETGCWEWTAYLSHGYGRYSVGKSERPAHRFAYELLVASVDASLDMDHLCRNRKCCNPDHLEPVTRRENLMRSPVMGPEWGVGARQRRKTHCPRGHEYNEENTRHYRGERSCRACDRARGPHGKRASENRSAA